MAHFADEQPPVGGAEGADESKGEGPVRSAPQHRNTGRYNMARLRQMMQLDDWFRESVTGVVGGDPDELNWDTDDVVGAGEDNSAAVDALFAQYTPEQQEALAPVKAEFLERVAALPADE